MEWIATGKKAPPSPTKRALLGNTSYRYMMRIKWEIQIEASSKFLYASTFDL